MIFFSFTTNISLFFISYFLHIKIEFEDKICKIDNLNFISILIKKNKMLVRKIFNFKGPITNIFKFGVDAKKLTIGVPLETY